MKKRRSSYLSSGFDSIDFSEGFGSLGMGGNETPMFLGRFSSSDILGYMNKTGLTDFLRGRDFDNFKIDIARDETLVSYLKIYSQEVKPANLLIDLRLSEAKFTPPAELIESMLQPSYDMVVIEWLSTEDPKKRSFAKDKPQLPGQKKPGLGCLRYMMAMMYYVTKDITKDGFLDVPDHFHLAVMYSSNFKFFNPHVEGKMRALMHDLKHNSLSDISWGVITGTVINRKNGEVFNYEPSEQIFAVSRKMKKYFDSRKYNSIVKDEQKKSEYYIDMDLMKAKRKELLEVKKISEI